VPTRDPELFHHPTCWPGAKLPHVWVTDRDRRRLSTSDLGGHGRFTLFTGIGGQEWVSAAAEVGAALGVEIVAVMIGPGCDYEDLYGDWAAVREIEDGGVLLVRPDNYVAFRQSSAPANGTAAGLLGAALRQILDRE